MESEIRLCRCVMHFNSDPEPEDFDAAKRMPEYQYATDADKYRLAQAAKLIRLARLVTRKFPAPEETG
jgi:hypothetical protein